MTDEENKEKPKEVKKVKKEKPKEEGGLREISVAEFFEKNRHLLGFDNPARALLTSVKEAVDNALDACEDADVLPEVKVSIRELSRDRYLMIVEDNGSGIDRVQIGPVFGKLLYGSKFQSIGGKQGRGQQGIGISAVVLYSQLTTGKPTKVWSKVKGKGAHEFILNIDTKRNEPAIVSESAVEWDKDHGTKIEVELIGKYLEKKASVPEYVKDTAVVNPHARIVYVDPKGQKLDFPRVIEALPKKAKRIRPHPHGIELGILMRMVKATKSRNLKSFLTGEFDRVGSGAAEEIIQNTARSIYAIEELGKEDFPAVMPLGAKEKIEEIIEHLKKVMPKLLTAEQLTALHKGMQTAKVTAPSTDCLSPIGSEQLKKSLEAEYDLEFSYAISRPATVYRGNPFQVEVAVGYGGELNKEGTVKLKRFANKVPLLYQQGACAITKSVSEVNWKAYGLQQSGNNLPIGPAIMVIHMASVWAPFTSESKDAVSHYSEIIKEMKLALQEAGRHLQRYVSKKQKAKIEAKKKHRSFAQQAVVALEKGLGITEDAKTRRRKILKKIGENSFISRRKKIKEPVRVIRKDRER